MNTKESSFKRNYIYSLPENILFHPEINLLEIKIYSLIRSFMDNSRECYPSNNWIANKCGVERRSVIRSLNKLLELGFIKKITIKDQRYLIINYTPCPEDLVTQMSQGDDTDVTGGGDPNVTQIISNINNTKNNKTNARAREVVSNEYPETLYPQPEVKMIVEMTVDNPHQIPEDLIDEWRQIRKTKRAPITKTVWKRLNNELSKFKGSPVEAFEEMVSRGWSTFKCEWVYKQSSGAPKEEFFEKRPGYLKDLGKTPYDDEGLYGF